MPQMNVAFLLEPRNRSYLYRVGVAVCLLLAGYGVINDNEILLINGVLAAVLGVADANVPRRGDV